MRALSAHLLVRVLAIALVSWVNVDVGFCSACASDPVAAASSGPVLEPGSAPHDARPGQLPHPTHCFYHAHWVEIPSSVMLAKSARQCARDPHARVRSPSAPRKLAFARILRSRLADTAPRLAGGDSTLLM